MSMLKKVALAASAAGAMVVGVASTFAASVTESGAIVVTAGEKDAIRTGLFAGVGNLVTLFMNFADVILLVGAAYLGFNFLKGLVNRR